MNVATASLALAIVAGVVPAGAAENETPTATAAIAGVHHSANEDWLRNYVSFNRKADLDALYARDKELHRKVVRIIQEVRSVPVPEVADWLRVRYGAKHGNVTPMYWSVSYPPQANLSFQLDGVRFFGSVPMIGFQADILYWRRMTRPD